MVTLQEYLDGCELWLFGSIHKLDVRHRTKANFKKVPAAIYFTSKYEAELAYIVWRLNK
jgi:hypothetical protein